VDKAVMGKFIAAFANPPAEAETEYATSVAAALFVSNNKAVLEMLEPKAGNLVDRLAKETDARKLAEELYLSVLSRMPDGDEVADVTAALGRSKDRLAMVKELVWGLLASTEFGVDH
jgi:hypothetical protein